MEKFKYDYLRIDGLQHKGTGQKRVRVTINQEYVDLDMARVRGVVEALIKSMGEDA